MRNTQKNAAEGGAPTTLAARTVELARLLEEGKGGGVVALDVSAISSWTSYFIIATSMSSTHWKGMYKLVKDYCRDSDGALEIYVPHQRLPDGDDWVLIDLGEIVIHLMSADARAFYELEKLWFGGARIYPEENAAAEA